MSSTATITTSDQRDSNGFTQTKVTEKLIPKRGLKAGTFKGSCTRQAVVMLACFVNHIIVVGFTSALGVIYVELIREFDALRSEAALVQSLYLGITVSGGIVFSRLVYRYGPGICITLGMTFSALSVCISAFSVNIYMVIVFVGVLTALGTSITFMCDFIAISWAFKTHKRSALAFLTIASTVGQVTFPYLAEIFLEKYFWNGALLLFSGVMLHTLPSGLLVHLSKHILEAQNADSPSETKTFNCVSIFKNCNMFFVVFIMLVMDIGASVEYYFTVDLSEMRGFDREVGASFLSILGFSSLFGRVTGTILLATCVNIRATSHYSHSLALFGVAHFVVIYFKQYIGMLVGIIFQGFSTGVTVSVYPGFLIEQFGVDNFPLALASTNVMSGVLDVIVGFFGGFVADVTGGYDVMYYIAAASSGLGSLITVIIIIYHNSCFAGPSLSAQKEIISQID